MTKRSATKEIIPADDLCQFCKKARYYYSAHGIRNGEVYDEHACVPCFANRHNISQEKVNRLVQETEELKVLNVPEDTEGSLTRLAAQTLEVKKAKIVESMEPDPAPVMAGLWSPKIPMNF
jgi:hypothetical protein